MNDEELIEIAKRRAAELVDEELGHHPELVPMRETLLKSKSKEVENQIQEKNDSLVNELQTASELIKDYFHSLAPEERENLLEDIPIIDDSTPQDPDRSLQENFGVTQAMIQSIYTFAGDLQKKENHKEASAVLKFLIVLNHKVAEFWIALGYSQMCLEQNEEALKSFKLAREIDPKNPAGCYFSAYAYRTLKDNDSAVKSLEEGLELAKNPEFANWVSTLNESLVSLTTKEKV